MWKKAGWATVVTMAILTSGCGQSESHADMDYQRLGYTFFGPGPINYEFIRDHPQPMYQGEVNHGTSFTTLNNERQDLGDDQRNIHQIARKNGWNSAYATVAGRHALVFVLADEDWSKDQRDKHLESLQAAYRQAVPKYQVDVHVLN